jgi:hypothetical protein
VSEQPQTADNDHLADLFCKQVRRSQVELRWAPRQLRLWTPLPTATFHPTFPNG